MDACAADLLPFSLNVTLQHKIFGHSSSFCHPRPADLAFTRSLAGSPWLSSRLGRGFDQFLRGQGQRRKTGGWRAGRPGGHGPQGHGLDPPPSRAGRHGIHFPSVPLLFPRTPEASGVLDAGRVSAAEADAGLRGGRLVDGGAGVAGAAGGVAAEDVAVLEAALAAADAALKWRNADYVTVMLH